MAKDMTRGNPFQLILNFSIPVFLGNLFQQFYTIVDTLIVGRTLGEEALAAVGASGSIVFLVLGFAIGMTQGFGVIVARVYGAKRYDRLKTTVFNSMFLGVVMSLLLTLVFLGQAEDLLLLMNTPSNIINDSLSYIKIIYYGIVGAVLYNTAASVLRGIGDSRTPLYFLIFSSFLNIALDLLFIIVFKMGVEGAALATITSQGISAIVAILYMFSKYDFIRPDKSNIQLDKDVILSLLKVGFSMALNYSIIALGIMFLQTGINRFGSGAVAAFTAAVRIENLVVQAMPAIGAGAATFAAQNLGAGEYKRIFAGVRTSFVMGIVVSIVSLALFFLFTETLVYQFLPELSDESMAYATQYTYTISFFLIFLQCIFIFRNVLQSVGNQVIPVISGILELLARYFVIDLFIDRLGYTAVVFSEPSAWVFAALINIIFYFIWKKRIIKKMELEA